MIGPYQIQREIGNGGMAVVYRAYDPRLQRPVALKVLLPHYRRQPDVAERFRREGHNAQQLQHPNIVPVYASDVTSGLPYIAMAYVEGESLEAWLRKHRSPLPLDYAANILVHIASALDYAHGRGVVHRDVKSSNILVNREWQAFLTDFGIAQAAGQSHITRAGEPVGTPAYMAPEQIKGRSVDKRADIYALGIVVYEMVTGRPPFQSDTQAAVLYQQVHEPPPPPRQFNPTLSPKVEKVILKALAKKPGKRYKSAGEFARAFWRAAPPSIQVPAPGQTAETSASTPPPTPAPAPTHTPDTNASPTPHPERRLSNGHILALAGVALVILVGAILLGTSAPRSAPPRAPASRRSPTPSASVTVTPDSEAPTLSTSVSAPKLTSPTDEAGLAVGEVVQLSWSDMVLEEGQRFRVEMRREDPPPDAESPVVSLPLNGIVPQSAHALEVPDLSTGGYQWRVKVEQREDGEWRTIAQSAWSAFEVGTPVEEEAPPVPRVTPQQEKQVPAVKEKSAACRPLAPSLVSPPSDSTHYGGVPVTFAWQGGRLCQGQMWQVMINNQHADCPPTQARSATCKTPFVATKQRYTWQVAVVNQRAHPVGTGSSNTFWIWLREP
jgi:serine/threonine protein kinase